MYLIDYLTKMYNQKSDFSHADAEANRPNWTSMPFWNNFTNFTIWNRQEPLLSTTDNPTISASNLSSLGTLENNLRVAQPEIDPLPSTQNQESAHSPQGSINRSTHSLEVCNSPTTEKLQLFNQLFTSLSVSLVSMILGFVCAYTSPAEDSLRHELGLSKTQIFWVGALMPLSAIIGGLIGGPLIDRFGRKTTIVGTDFLFLVSLICIAVANVWSFGVGRIIAGIAVGIACVALPVYLSETIQPKVRGTLGLFPTALANIGIVLCFVAGSYLSASIVAWLGVVLSIPFLGLAFNLDETPCWYISKGREECARNSLQWLRGKDTDIQEEFDSLAKSQRESDLNPSSGFSAFITRTNSKPVLISLGLMFFQQMSGIKIVIFYTTDIFEMAGFTIDTNLCMIIVGVVNCISTLIAIILIDRLGRKVLLYVSSVFMIITLGTLGTYFYLATKVDVSEYGWLPLASFFVYVLGFSLGFGAIPWLMIGEIFPAKIRGTAASVATASNWICTFIAAKIFIDIIATAGPHCTCWLFAAVCGVSLVFVVFGVPETRGQSLQDIETKLTGLKVVRMSSISNLEAVPSTL